jgi:hypothetical protein
MAWAIMRALREVLWFTFHELADSLGAHVQ